MKKSVRNILSIAIVGVLALSMVACGSNSSNKGKGNDKKITIGVSPNPHEKIIKEAVKPLLEEKGYEIDIVTFNDFVQPNTALAEKQLDANYFQHVPYLEETNKAKGYDLSYTVKVHLEPMGVYSNSIKGINELKEGSEIAIPNDPTNCSRALKLLADNGLIKISEGELITSKDITDNPKNFKITELAAEQIPRALKDVDAAVINTNYALEGGLNPLKDALIIEDKDSPYANILAVRKEDENTEKIKVITEALTSPEVKEYIEKTYEGAIIPAF